MKKLAAFAAILMMAFSIAAYAAGPQAPASDDAFRPGMKPEKLTVIDFNATWCGPCRLFAPAFDSAAERLGAKIDFVSIDVDKYPQTAAAFNIQAIPTIVIIDPDGTAAEHVGLGDFLAGLNEDDDPSMEQISEAMGANLEAIIMQHPSAR